MAEIRRNFRRPEKSGGIFIPPGGFPGEMPATQRGRTIWMATQNPRFNEAIGLIRAGGTNSELVALGFPTDMANELRKWFVSSGGRIRQRGPKNSPGLAAKAGVLWDLTDPKFASRKPMATIAGIARRREVSTNIVEKLYRDFVKTGKIVSYPTQDFGTRQTVPIMGHFTQSEMNSIWNEHHVLPLSLVTGYRRIFAEAGIERDEFEVLAYQFFIYGLRRYDPNAKRKDGSGRSTLVTPQSFAANSVRQGFRAMVQARNGRILRKTVLGVENPLYGRVPDLPSSEGRVDDSFERTRAEPLVPQESHASQERNSKAYARIVESIKARSIPISSPEDMYGALYDFLSLLQARLTPAQINILYLVLENPEETMARLATRIHRRKQTIHAGVNAICRAIGKL